MANIGTYCGGNDHDPWRFQGKGHAGRNRLSIAQMFSHPETAGSRCNRALRQLNGFAGRHKPVKAHTKPDIH
jgi:hypothetical protein